MLVIIDGITIDTTKIYTLTPVIGGRNGWINLSFDVLFLDKKDMSFTIKTYLYVDSTERKFQYIPTIELNPNMVWINGDYKDHWAYKEAEIKIQAAHDLLVIYWNESKSPIPEIKIN